jgi:hypothetical protein
MQSYAHVILHIKGKRKKRNHSSIPGTHLFSVLNERKQEVKPT